MEHRLVVNRRIILDEELSVADLEQLVAEGARFVAFPYVVALLFAVVLQRMSPAYLVTKGESVKKYGNRYNRISYLLGWWHIPSGPGRTIQSIRINNKGGIDVTADIMKNMTAEAIRSGFVTIAQVATLFEEPVPADLKAFRSALSSKAGRVLDLDRLVVGLFLDVPYDREPFYILGLDTRHGFAYQCDLLRQALYTEFYKNVYFEFIDIANDSSELSRSLQEQGTMLLGARENRS